MLLHLLGIGELAILGDGPYQRRPRTLRKREKKNFQRLIEKLKRLAFETRLQQEADRYLAGSVAYLYLSVVDRLFPLGQTVVFLSVRSALE